MEYNQQFVESEGYKEYITSTKYPTKEMVIVSCMDTRLTELLPRAMSIHNGDAKIIKVAGAVINQPFGSVMRSIIVAVHDLGAEEVFIVGHDDCGMSTIQPEKMIAKMIDGGISEEKITVLEQAGINIRKWLMGFDCVDENVISSVEKVRNHPLMPSYVKVSGLVIHPTTGALRVVANGHVGSTSNVKKKLVN